MTDGFVEVSHVLTSVYATAKVWGFCVTRVYYFIVARGGT